MPQKGNPHIKVIAKSHLLASFFLFLFVASSQAITITGSETISRSSSSSYTATGGSGLVTWSVAGTGASISANGVLTATANACGSFTVTASGSDGWRRDKGRPKVKRGHGSQDHIHVDGQDKWYPIKKK